MIRSTPDVHECAGGLAFPLTNHICFAVALLIAEVVADL